MGDQNADPADGDSTGGDSTGGAIRQLLDHPLVNTRVTPASNGGRNAAQRQGRANTVQSGDPAFDTADFFDGRRQSFATAPGNLRTDYVLPSKALRIIDAAVFWPAEGDPLFRLVGSGFPVVSSDHRLVWVDVAIPRGD